MLYVRKIGVALVAVLALMLPIAGVAAGGVPPSFAPVAAPTAPAEFPLTILPLTAPEAATEGWIPVTGRWVFTAEGYRQTMLDDFDFISFKQRLSGDFRYQAHTRFVAGRMGAGLVFNAPTSTSKRGAYMVSYSEGGTFLQCGYFDQNGIFQFQYGRPVPDGGDGQWHTIEVVVSGNTYSVVLDGDEIGSGIPLLSRSEGYIGLLASTSEVVFDYIGLGIQPR